MLVGNVLKCVKHKIEMEELKIYEFQKIIVYKDGSYKFVDVSWEYENDPDWLTTITIKGCLSFDPLRNVLNKLQERIDNPNARHYVTSELKECWNIISEYITENETSPPPPVNTEKQTDLWDEVLTYCADRFVNDIRVLEYLSKRYEIKRKES